MGSDANRAYAFSLVRVAAAPNETLSLHTVSGIEQLLELMLDGTVARVRGADPRRLRRVV